MTGQNPDPDNAGRDDSPAEGSALESRLSKAAKHIHSGQVAIILPFLGAAIFLCRCLGATNQDIRQAQILFSVSQISDVLRVVIFQMIPLVCAIGYNLAGLLTGAALWRRNFPRALRWALVGLATVALQTLSYGVLGMGTRFDFVSLAASALVFFISVVCGSISEWRIRPIALVPVIFVALFFASEVVNSDRMWVPQERLVTATTTTVGYVVGVSEDHFYVLFEGTRDVSLVPKADVTSRKLCPAQC